ncbi:MAG: response regulator [Oligoflexales bacterium]|nr:response regulator [Oligoflexales bacterium]
MKKVLLITNEYQCQEELTKKLKTRNLEVLRALNGFEGVKMFKKFRPDLVITGIIIPVLDGIEVIKSIRRVDVEVPILVCCDGNNPNMPTDELFKELLVTHAIASQTNCDEIVTVVESIFDKMEEERMAREKAQEEKKKDPSDNS